ncbi:MAG: hypothetical protein ACI8RD_006231, partial [Bacillariaceae sp.]
QSCRRSDRQLTRGVHAFSLSFKVVDVIASRQYHYILLWE